LADRSQVPCGLPSAGLDLLYVPNIGTGKVQKDEKHYNARTRELIEESRMSAYQSPYEEKLSKIVRVESHHQNDRSRLFLYCITEDSKNSHYLSLQKAVSLNESLVYSYLYVNKLTLHPEIQNLGIDKKISKLIENLDLDDSNRADFRG
jgi:hypothetical protein